MLSTQDSLNDMCQMLYLVEIIMIIKMIYRS